MHFVCDFCLAGYQKPYDKLFIKRQFHFCQKVCLFSSSKKGGLLYSYRRKSNLKKYGVSSPSKLESVKRKQAQTNIKKYGVKSVSQVDEIRKKQVATCEARYGFPVPSMNKEIKQKIEQTCIKRFGSAAACAAPLVRQKIRNTMQKRHGVDFFVEHETFAQKTKETCLKRYGVENVFLHEEFRKKQRSTMLRRHGVEHNFSMPSVRQNTYKSNKRISKPEQIFLELLLHSGYRKKEIDCQVPVRNWIIDFLIKPLDLFVQIDGVYWHGLDRNIIEIQKSILRRDLAIHRRFFEDKKQNIWFKKRKMKLVRFTDLQVIEFRKNNVYQNETMY